MDIPRIEILNRYWAQYPPTHVLLAAQVGWRPPERADAPIDEQQEQDFIPPQHLPQADFEQLLRDKGLI